MPQSGAAQGYALPGQQYDDISMETQDSVASRTQIASSSRTTSASPSTTAAVKKAATDLSKSKDANLALQTAEYFDKIQECRTGDYTLQGKNPIFKNDLTFITSVEKQRGGACGVRAFFRTDDGEGDTIRWNVNCSLGKDDLAILSPELANQLANGEIGFNSPFSRLMCNKCTIFQSGRKFKCLN